MIKFTNTAVYGWEAAIRGMRNPHNSWDRSDSYPVPNGYYLGPNDKSLAERLIRAGSDHAKFMRMITVSVDVVAPLYWWKEYDTYKVATVANSCSTMHKIHAKEFTLDDFSHEKLNPMSVTVLNTVIHELNLNRGHFINHNDKHFWYQMIQLLPSSYNQLRTITLNYATLRNIYHARRHHKLDEWHTFCAWIETLPNSDLITGG